MKQYPLFKVHVPKVEALARISEVFESGFINEGVQVIQLTNALSRRLKTNRLVLMNSCTSAISLALWLSGVCQGDDVVSTPMTCVATNTPIVTSGAKIVWADINPVTGMIDPADVRRKITERTKAVIAVAWAGTPPELESLREICNARGVKLILDAAHAFDAKYEGRDIHEYADFTCYSFQAIKHFTTGDGGALICADEKMYKRAKALKWFGMDRDLAKNDKGEWRGRQWETDIVEAGYKFNMNNVAAAIGLAQLRHIDEILETHRSNGLAYAAAFKDFSPISTYNTPVDTLSSFWVYTVKITPHSKLTRDELLTSLNAENIMAGIVHVPNDLYTAFKEFRAELPGVREFSANQLSLPCGWWLSKDDVNHIVTRVMDLTR